MKNIRKGNDIHAYWRIFDGAGADYSLEGKNIALHLKDVLDHEMTISNVSITGSVIEFYFFGKNQTTLGRHALILVENEGLEGMHTIDIADAFVLVSHTFQEGGDNACSHIRTETIRLSGTINAGHAGSPGAAAGFGEVTAEINNNTGTPSVEVETSGPDTAKNFHFSFKNLKGGKGDPGSDATVTSESIANALGYTPVQPSDIASFITRSVNDLTNYYLKSETYTKGEVAALIGAIQQFHYEIYASLADVSSPASNVLYLIGPTGTGSDRYEEYVYANGAFTKIGDTSIDLSGYVTTQALNAALADYTTTANLSQLLSDKENISNKTTSLSSASTDQQYPSAKAVYDFVAAAIGGAIDETYPQNE